MEQYRALVQPFVRLCAECLATLKEHVDGRRSIADWQKAARTLKEAANTHGAHRLAVICQSAIERAAAGAEEKRVILGQVEDYFFEIQALF